MARTGTRSIAVPDEVFAYFAQLEKRTGFKGKGAFIKNMIQIYGEDYQSRLTSPIQVRGTSPVPTSYPSDTSTGDGKLAALKKLDFK